MPEFRNDRGLDITKNVKTIELLKSNLLKELSKLYETMAKGRQEGDDKSEVLAEIVMNAYILGERLGIDYQQLDETMVSRLRLLAVDEANSISANTGGLIKHISSRNRNSGN